MPKFNPSQHPRDRFGRFTKSRTVKASAKDRAAAKQVAEGFAPKQVSRQERAAYLAGISGAGQRGLGDVAAANKALRAGTDAPEAARIEQGMVPLPDDLLLSRIVPAAAFGATDPSSLQGMKVRDAGFAPARLGTAPAADGQVRMHIAAPAGTRAAVDPDTGEVVLDKDTEMVVAKVEANAAGGHDMYLTVLPKQAAEAGPEKPGRTDEPKRTKTAKPEPADDRPEGGDQVRADLMKLKVAELQAQMRERGLKTGRLRKSQLVDALTADEVGGPESQTSADGSDLRPAPRGKTAPSARRAADGPSAGWRAGITGDQAFDAATPIEGAARKLASDKRIRARDMARVMRAASAYGRDPRDSDVNYVTINAAVRGHGGDISPDASGEIEQAVRDLDSLLSGAPTVRDMITYRGIQNPAAAIPGWRAGADNVGLEWTAEGYQSTTTGYGTAVAFASGMMPGGARSKTPMVARVLIPKGATGLKLSPMVTEILTARNQRFRLVGDRGVESGVRQLDIELIAGGDGDGSSGGSAAG